MTPNATGLTDTPPGAEAPAEGTTTAQTTTVDVRACGRFRRQFDENRFEFTFEGDTLREFVGALLGERPELADLLIGETRHEDDAGWTDIRDDLGAGKRPFVRVMVNGTFNEYRGGAEAELSDGDRIELVEPLTY
ncbi:MoaD/ThiS family protein [Haloglomus salinum]|jgi:molybdopterin converting factor small subunit|uniref:MoaD/ThiS family protein n=1 Tax=Haloglomus salinum TaxID=2962673 RepID=UPI0020C9798A|nr:MoaD/ThiS family protein [Haloglomus salinum]